MMQGMVGGWTSTRRRRRKRVKSETRREVPPMVLEEEEEEKDCIQQVFWIETLGAIVEGGDTMGVKVEEDAQQAPHQIVLEEEWVESHQEQEVVEGVEKEKPCLQERQPCMRAAVIRRLEKDAQQRCRWGGWWGTRRQPIFWGGFRALLHPEEGQEEEEEREHQSVEGKVEQRQATQEEQELEQESFWIGLQVLWRHVDAVQRRRLEQGLPQSLREEHQENHHDKEVEEETCRGIVIQGQFSL
jgi:hypothetical protein